jgi:hypothetical protein
MGTEQTEPALSDFSDQLLSTNAIRRVLRRVSSNDEAKADPASETSSLKTEIKTMATQPQSNGHNDEQELARALGELPPNVLASLKELPSEFLQTLGGLSPESLDSLTRIPIELLARLSKLSAASLEWLGHAGSKLAALPPESLAKFAQLASDKPNAIAQLKRLDAATVHALMSVPANVMSSLADLPIDLLKQLPDALSGSSETLTEIPANLSTKDDSADELARNQATLDALTPESIKTLAELPPDAVETIAQLDPQILATIASIPDDVLETISELPPGALTTVFDLPIGEMKEIADCDKQVMRAIAKQSEPNQPKPTPVVPAKVFNNIKKIGSTAGKRLNDIISEARSMRELNAAQDSFREEFEHDLDPDNGLGTASELPALKSSGKQESDAKDDGRATMQQPDAEEADGDGSDKTMQSDDWSEGLSAFDADAPRRGRSRSETESADFSHGIDPEGVSDDDEDSYGGTVQSDEILPDGQLASSKAKRNQDDDSYGATVQSDEFAAVAKHTDDDEDSYGATIQSDDGSLEVDGLSAFDRSSDKSVSDEDSFGATIQSDSSFSGKPDGDDSYGATIQSDSFDAGASGSGKSDDDDSYGATVQSDSFDAGASSSNDDSVNQTMVSEEFSSPGGDESFAQTISSKSNFDEDEAQRTMASVWGDDLDGDGNPCMTMKGDERKTSTPRVKTTKQALVITTRQLGTKAVPDFNKDKRLPEPAEPEYELIKILGEGGMGIVFEARQRAIDREVAVKMLKSKTAKDKEQRAKFLTEAVVTGELDHPNIVPIYDVGAFADSALFYAMKKVQGTPWLKVVKEKSTTENLEILMRTADAVAFAHARGVIHRDLKPENVMLGSFGEVLVMDWGLAYSTKDFRKSQSITENTSMGGTPAYMAPEMATGPINKVGPHSDVYLLAAMLFEIVTGKPPHAGKNAMKCLMSAARNEIREPDPEVALKNDPTGELLALAMKSMSTDPKDRHRSVLDFQAAIRDYQSHTESVTLSARAREDLKTARSTDNYQDYARAVFGFEEAHEMWSGNNAAKEGVVEAKFSYAQTAKRKGDLDLGMSLLDVTIPAHKQLYDELKFEVNEREARKAAVARYKKIGAVSAVVFMFVISGAAIWVNAARNEAIAQREIAVENEKEAKKQEGIAKENFAEAKRQEGIAIANLEEADKQRRIAIANEKEALKQKEEADKQRIEADSQRMIAVKNEQEAVKQKTLAETNFKEAEVQRKKAENNFIEAEKQRALAVTNEKEAKKQEGIAKENAVIAQKNAAEAKKNAMEALAQKGIAEKNAEEARKQEKLAKNNEVEAKKQQGIAEKNEAEAKKQQMIAQTNEKKAIEQEGIAKKNAEEALKQKKLADDQRLIAEQKRKEAEAAKEAEEYQSYIARIGLADARIRENAFDTATQILNECPERLRNWEWGRLMHLCTLSKGSFDNGAPVDAVAVSPRGGLFVTGGWNGEAIIWDSVSGKAVRHLKHDGLYVHAVAYSPDGKWIATGSNDPVNGFVQLWNAETGERVARPFGRNDTAHSDAVLSVQFSKDGSKLLTGSYDNTARLWNVANGEQIKAFVGHTWWVWDAKLSPKEDKVVTASQDGTAIVWEVATGKAGPPFTGHQGPVYSIAFSHDGFTVATGGYDKRVLLWKPNEVRPYDFSKLASKEGQVVQQQRFKSLDGHGGPVRSVMFSRDDQLLVTGSQDNTVRLWSPEAGQLVKSFRGHDGAVRSATFAESDQVVLSAGHDNRIKKWSIGQYEEIRVLQGVVLEGHVDAILAAGFSPDGKQVVTASRDRTARTWDSVTGNPLKVFSEGHSFLASNAVYFPDGKRMATAAVDNSVRIWDTDSGTQMVVLEHTGRAAALAISNDGKWIITGGDDRSAKIFDSQTGELKFVLPDHRSEVTAVALSPDGRLALTGDLRGRVALWDIKTQKIVQELNGHARARITGAAFVDANRVITSSADNSVAQWNVETGKELPNLILKHSDSVNSIVLRPKTRQLITASEDKLVRVWDLDTAKVVSSWKAPSSINAVATDATGEWALAVESDSRKVHLWKIGNGEQITPERELEVKGPLWSAIFAPTRNGQTLLTLGGSDAKLINVESKEVRLTFSPHGVVASASFSPKGDRIVTGSWDFSARVWNAITGADELKLGGEEGHSGYVNSAVFSPDKDGKLVLTASDDGTAKLWDSKTGKLVRTLTGHTDRVRHAAFSPNGQQAVTSSSDKTAIIWDVATGKPIGKPLNGHKWAVLFAQFSSDGSKLITGSEDNLAAVWDVATGKALLQLSGHTARVTSVAFAPDDNRAVTASQDGSVKLWDTNLKADETKPADDFAKARMAKEILTLDGHTREVTSVTFSPDGRYVLTGSQDGRAILWLASTWADPSKKVAVSKQ